MRLSDLLIVAAAFTGAQSAMAAEPALPAEAGSLFTQALRDGEATAPAPAIGLFDGALRALQEQVGDPGPIYVKARRVFRFVQQTHCGRIAFALYQPSSHHAWPSLGGQLNICEDGLPPLRACEERPTVLVPSTSTCQDKSSPRDTAEVAASIRAALATGDITPADARQRAAARAKAGSQARPVSGVAP